MVNKNVKTHFDFNGFLSPSSNVSIGHMIAVYYQKCRASTVLTLNNMTSALDQNAGQCL